jgi:hypothetical protein
LSPPPSEYQWTTYEELRQVQYTLTLDIHTASHLDWLESGIGARNKDTGMYNAGKYVWKFGLHREQCCGLRDY